MVIRLDLGLRFRSSASFAPGSVGLPKMTPHDRSKLEEAILSLPELQAQIIIRFYLRNESAASICQNLELTERQFSKTHFEALKSLRSADDGTTA